MIIRNPNQLEGYPANLKKRLWGVYVGSVLVFVSPREDSAYQVKDGWNRTYPNKAVLSPYTGPWNPQNQTSYPREMRFPIVAKVRGLMGMKKELFWGWTIPEYKGAIEWALVTLGLKYRGNSITSAAFS